MGVMCSWWMQVVSGGGSAVDAVEAAVVVLEDNPAFDAGAWVVWYIHTRIYICAKANLSQKFT